MLRLSRWIDQEGIGWMAFLRDTPILFLGELNISLQHSSRHNIHMPWFRQLEEGMGDILLTLGYWVTPHPSNWEEGVDDILLTLGYWVTPHPSNWEEGMDDILLTLGYWVTPHPSNWEEDVDDFLLTLGNTTPLERLPSCQMNAPVLSDVPNDIQTLMDSHWWTRTHLSCLYKRAGNVIGGYRVKDSRQSLLAL